MALFLLEKPGLYANAADGRSRAGRGVAPAAARLRKNADRR